MTPPKGEEHVGRSSTIVQTFKSICHTIAKISVVCTHTHKNRVTADENHEISDKTHISVVFAG